MRIFSLNFPIDISILGYNKKARATPRSNKNTLNYFNNTMQTVQFTKMFRNRPPMFRTLSYKTQVMFYRCCDEMYYGNNTVGMNYTHALKIIDLDIRHAKKELAPLIDLGLIKKLDTGALMVNPKYASCLNSKKKASQIAWLQQNFDNGTFVPTVEPIEDQE